MSPEFVIAIDGPAGAGKSTVAQRLAKALDVPYVYPGALLRDAHKRRRLGELPFEPQAVLGDWRRPVDGGEHGAGIALASCANLAIGVSTSFPAVMIKSANSSTTNTI